MSYPRNAATPKAVTIGRITLIADGSAVTSGASVRVSLDGGAWGAGGGSLSYDTTSEEVSYAPIQAETNGDVLRISVYKAGCIGCQATVFMDPVALPAVAAGGNGGLPTVDANNTVKLRTGTGAGELDFTSGVVKSNLAQILATALTEDAGGWLAAGFKKFFNVETPTGTVNSLPDAVAGAAGGVSIVGSKMKAERPPHHWYVTKGGNDSTGDGSESTPYLTFAKVLTVAASGDHVHFGTGTWSEAADASALPLHLIGMGKGLTVLTQAAEDHTLKIDDGGTIEDMSVIQTKAASAGLSAIDCAGKSGIRLLRVGIESTATAISGAGASGWAEDVTIAAAEAGYSGGSWIITRPDIALSGWTACAAFGIQNGGITVVMGGQVSVEANTDTDFVAGIENQGTRCLVVGTDVYAQNTGLAGVYGLKGVKAVACAVLASGTNAAFLHAANDCKLFQCTTATNPATGEERYDVADSTVSGTDYDGAKTSGTITQVEPGTSLLARLGAFTGTGVNTVLGFLKALASKAASTPSDIGGTFSAAADALEAIRDRGDAAWTTADVSGIATIITAINALQNNTRVKLLVPSVMERPDADSTAYAIEIMLYDEAGNMEAPDELPTLTVKNQAGDDLSANLGVVTPVSTGYYTCTYTLADDDDMDQLRFTLSVVEGGTTRVHGALSLIVDTTAADFTSADREQLDALHDTLDEAGVFSETALAKAPAAEVELTPEQIAAIVNDLIEGGLAKEETLDAVAALIAAIKARTDTLGAGVVSYVGSVASGGTANLYQDNDYTEVLGNRPYWDITGYSGPDIDGEEGEFRMARARRIADSSGAPFAAEFECACTFAQTGSTVRATLDDVEADDLAGLIVEGARTNYTWQIWHGSRALATGTLVLHRGVAAAS
jgi:Fe-S cluster assembly iron-binding protein IscA